MRVVQIVVAVMLCACACAAPEGMELPGPDASVPLGPPEALPAELPTPTADDVSFAGAAGPDRPFELGSANTFADVLWHEPGSGAFGYHRLFDGSFESSGALPSVTGWRIDTTGDVDGDGWDDVLWTHLGTGDRAIWIMEGYRPVVYIAFSRVSLNWRMVGVTRVDSDALPDIVWRDDSEAGLIAVWRMAAVDRTSGSWPVVAGWLLPSTDAPYAVPPPWTMPSRGVQDVNGDGVPDLIWRDASGPAGAGVWLMARSGTDSLQATGWMSIDAASGVPSYWSLAVTEDFDRDGAVDMLWRGAGGETQYWFLSRPNASSRSIAIEGVRDYFAIGQPWYPAGVLRRSSPFEAGTNPRSIRQLAILVGGPASSRITRSDIELRRSLERAGLTTSYVPLAELTQARVNEADVVVISASVLSSEVPDWLRTVPRPMVIAEPNLMLRWGLASAAGTQPDNDVRGGILEREVSIAITTDSVSPVFRQELERLAGTSRRTTVFAGPGYVLSWANPVRGRCYAHVAGRPERCVLALTAVGEAPRVTVFPWAPDRSLTGGATATSTAAFTEQGDRLVQIALGLSTGRFQPGRH